MDRDYFLNPGLHFEPSSQRTWKPITTAAGDQYTQFESAISTMGSSPASNSTVSKDIAAVREIVGKLGCKFSSAAMTSPPLDSSPPNLNSPITDHLLKQNIPSIRNPIQVNPNLQLLADDPGFAERAAKFSRLGNRSFNGRTNQLGLNSNKTEPVFESGVKLPRVSSSPALNSDEINMKLSRLSASAANSISESSVSEQIQEIGFKNQKDSTSRKRKKEQDAVDDSKKLKKTEALEPPKDYIHVRARRGQATDSHSLAERVRREKISERMKLLQNLVPNCNKVTGKALMLDEIINYVQSLQKQVEFLSMKLATVNPSLDFATNDTISPNVPNITQSNGSLSQQTSTLYQQDHQPLFNESDPVTQSIHQFTEPFPHFRGFGQDELQSIVRMGYGENLNFDTSFFRTTMDQPSNMKTEL